MLIQIHTEDTRSIECDVIFVDGVDQNMDRCLVLGTKEPFSRSRLKSKIEKKIVLISLYDFETPFSNVNPVTECRVARENKRNMLDSMSELVVPSGFSEMLRLERASFSNLFHIVWGRFDDLAGKHLSNAGHRYHDILTYGTA